MASAVLVRELFRDQLGSVDLAGFLTPWALHEFAGRIEQPVNEIVTESALKYRPGYARRPLRTFFEPKLVGLNQSLDLGIEKLYAFSLQHGSEALHLEFRDLLQDRSYESIIVIDVGGDCLGSELDRAAIRSPIVDWLCMDLVAAAPTAVTTHLAIVVPGSDGELPPRAIEDVLSRLACANAEFERLTLTADSSAFQRYARLNEALNRSTGSVSRTEAIVRAGLAGEGDLRLRQDLDCGVGHRTWKVPHTVEVGASYRNVVLIGDLRRVRKARAAPPVTFDSVLEAALDFTRRGFCGTELDLATVVPPPFPANRREPLLFLTPCRLIQDEAREEILVEGASAALAGDLPPALVRTDDLKLLPASLRSAAQRTCPAFSILGPTPAAVRLAEIVSSLA